MLGEVCVSRYSFGGHFEQTACGIGLAAAAVAGVVGAAIVTVDPKISEKLREVDTVIYLCLFITAILGCRTPRLILKEIGVVGKPRGFQTTVAPALTCVYRSGDQTQSLSRSNRWNLLPLLDRFVPLCPTGIPLHDI
jgi:hypothetical protein